MVKYAIVGVQESVGRELLSFFDEDGIKYGIHDFRCS